MNLLGLQASSLLRFLAFLPPPPSAGGFYEHLHTSRNYLKAPTAGERAGVPQQILINHMSPLISRCYSGVEQNRLIAAGVGSSSTQASPAQ